MTVEKNQSVKTSRLTPKTSEIGYRNVKLILLESEQSKQNSSQIGSIAGDFKLIRTLTPQVQRL